jgi:hypothetical protein
VDKAEASSGDAFDAALAKSGFADMRPVYRTLLRRLKESDPEGFREATGRYEATVTPALAAAGSDPITVWTGYGVWLARRLGPGRFVHLDASGLAAAADEPVAVSGRVLLYLPEAEKEPAVSLARPAEPTAAQLAALKLLVR